MSVNEVADYEDYRNIFKWDPAGDTQLSNFGKSVLLTSVSERVGLSKKEISDELERRKQVLHWMRERNIRSYRDVAAIIGEYYARPKQIYDKIIAGEEVRPIAVSRNP
jgi:flagellar protein FlaI